MQSVGERSSVEGLCTVELVLHRRRIFGSKNGGRRRLRGNAYLYDRYLIAILFAFILHCCFLHIPLLLFAMECTVLVRNLCMTAAFALCCYILQ